MRKKKAERDDARTSEPVARQRMTPAEIQQAEFSQSFRGYNELEVDELLDRLTEDWTAVIEENKRLREGSSAGVSGAADTGVADARKEADEILSRARGEAEAILRNAEAGASSGRPTAAPSLGDGGNVGPFLTKERDFLQSLGRLVQAHAESVKSMAQNARPSEGTREAPAAPPAPPASAASSQAGDQTQPRAAPVPARPAERPAAPAPQAPRPSTPRQVPASGPPTQPVVKIDAEQGPPTPEAEPQPATASRTDAPQRVDAVRIPEAPADRQAPQRSAEGQADPASAPNRSSQEDELSLRELFWGDE
ncbi:MAG: DivIVA domain-containing protein [Actinomycetota bacterium]|nr:DivIVA domain-containing protein [Actinomycetota bacterium]